MGTQGTTLGAQILELRAVLGTQGAVLVTEGVILGTQVTVLGTQVAVLSRKYVIGHLGKQSISIVLIAICMKNFKRYEITIQF